MRHAEDSTEEWHPGVDPEHSTGTLDRLALPDNGRCKQPQFSASALLPKRWQPRSTSTGVELRRPGAASPLAARRVIIPFAHALIQAGVYDTCSGAGAASCTGGRQIG